MAVLTRHSPEALSALLNCPISKVELLNGDAGLRLYHRLFSDKKTFVLTDTSRSPEDATPFVTITNLLQQAEIPVPNIIACDLDNHMIIQSDLGNTTLLDLLVDLLNNKKDQRLLTQQAYQKAMNILTKVQAIPLEKLSKLPRYNKQKLMTESLCYPKWCLNRYLKIALTAKQESALHEAFERFVHYALAQPQCFVHRDFHSRNIMVGPDQQLTVIDYQDAVVGPVTYDIVSLLKDCYIQWPREIVISMLKTFHQQTSPVHGNLSWDEYVFLFDIMGLQRHLKVLGVFCRLNLRDHKNTFLKDLPRVAHYALEACNLHPEFSSITPIVQQTYDQVCQ